MGNDTARSIRITGDAYKAVSELKKELKKIGTTYSISDIILVSSVTTGLVSKKAPDLIVSMANTAKFLRIKKLRGESGADIPETLVSEYSDKVLEMLDGGESKKHTISDVIKTLLRDGYPDAAADILFTYRQMFGEREFKNLSAEILECQVELKRRFDSGE